jgi:hypothetical protein
MQVHNIPLVHVEENKSPKPPSYLASRNSILIGNTSLISRNSKYSSADGKNGGDYLMPSANHISHLSSLIQEQSPEIYKI